MKMNLETVLENRKREDTLPVKSIFLSFIIHISLIAVIYFASTIFVSYKEFSPFISASLVPAKGLPGFVPSKLSDEKSSEKSREEISRVPKEEKAVTLPSLVESQKTKDKKDKKDTLKESKKKSQTADTKGGDRSPSESSERYGLPYGSEEGYGAEPGSISSITVDEFEYTWYSASVAGILSKNWVRSIAPPEQRGTSVIARFRIYEDGRIDDIYLIKKSNFFALDQEVLRAIQNSSPLPPLPKGFQKKSLVAQYEFVY